MKKLLQNTLFPFAIFTSGVLLMGCEQSQSPQSSTDQTSESTSTQTVQQELSSGNMLYIVRDVADVQMKAGEYFEKLKETQTSLESAIQSQDTAQLQALAEQLKSQITGLDQTLESLNLKSQEIDNIREKIQFANEQVLASPFLNGEIDIAKMNFNEIEQQMNTVQDEMIKLAGMMISSNDKSSS